jgi:hypothetical protein
MVRDDGLARWTILRAMIYAWFMAAVSQEKVAQTATLRWCGVSFGPATGAYGNIHRTLHFKFKAASSFNKDIHPHHY